MTIYIIRHFAGLAWMPAIEVKGRYIRFLPLAEIELRTVFVGAGLPNGQKYS